MEMELTSPWRKSRASNPNGACIELAAADALRYRKSSHCTSRECVEVGHDGVVLVRDTKQEHLPDDQRSMLVFSSAAWRRFTAGLK